MKADCIRESVVEVVQLQLGFVFLESPAYLFVRVLAFCSFRSALRDQCVAETNDNERRKCAD